MKQIVYERGERKCPLTMPNSHPKNVPISLSLHPTRPRKKERFYLVYKQLSGSPLRANENFDADGFLFTSVRNEPFSISSRRSDLMGGTG